MNASNSNAFSPKRWEQTERGEHDAIYRDSRPFDCRTYLIDPEHVIWWQDYCYKPGRRRDRGHRTRRVFELIDLESVKDKTILDVGCGNGQYSVFFALLGATAYGFDISPVGIEVARRMAAENGVSERCSFSVQNASNMDYPDEWFDIVLFHEVLHHAIKYPNVREETLRVLKTGGLAICAESLAGNKLLTLGRSVTMRGKEELGDVQLTIANLEEFSRGFSSSRLELMSLLFMSKRIFVNYLHLPPVRWFLFLTKKLDDVVLSAFPSLRRHCGECILVLRK